MTPPLAAAAKRRASGKLAGFAGLASKANSIADHVRYRGENDPSGLLGQAGGI